MLNLADLEQTTSTSPTEQVMALLGYVSRAPSSTSDTIGVVLPIHSRDHEWTTSFYTARAGALPQKGDTALVLMDDSGIAHVVQWGDVATGAEDVAAVVDAYVNSGTHTASFTTLTAQALNATNSKTTNARVTNRAVFDAGASNKLWNIDNSASVMRFFSEDYNATGSGANGYVAATLDKDGYFSVKQNLVANQGTAAETRIGDVGGTRGGVWFRNAANNGWLFIYRDAGDILRTDNRFLFAGGLRFPSGVGIFRPDDAGYSFVPANDQNLYYAPTHTFRDASGNNPGTIGVGQVYAANYLRTMSDQAGGAIVGYNAFSGAGGWLSFHNGTNWYAGIGRESGGLGFRMDNGDSGNGFVAQWNRTGGQGETDFVNRYTGNYNGDQFNFYRYDGTLIGRVVGSGYFSGNGLMDMSRVTRIWWNPSYGSEYRLGSPSGFLEHRFYYSDGTTYANVRAASFPTGSDRRWKTQISTVEGGLATVRRLRGVRFKWNDMSPMTERDAFEWGFVAQEVNEVMPEVVIREPDSDFLGIDYTRFAPVLVEAVKELAQENDDLKARVDGLEHDVEALKSALSKLTGGES